MRRSLSFGALAISAVLVVAGCGGDDDTTNDAAPTPTADDMAEAGADDTTDAGSPTVALSAADLRATLEVELQEHVYLAGAATGEALGGRTDAFEAAAAALDANSDDIVEAIRAVYGDDAAGAFDPLWRKHIGFFVDYTTARGAGDQAGADAAIAELTAYADEFGAFLESATDGNLTKDTVAGLVGEHATTLIAAIDAQAAGDASAAYRSLKEAASHMTMIAAPLATAIATQQNLT